MSANPTALFRKPAPEEAELPYRRVELAALRKTLATHERDLTHLRDQLHSFEGRYIRQVGVLYVQLDDWEEKLADLLTGREPKPEPAAAPTSRPQILAAADEQALAEATAVDAFAKQLQAARALRTLFREVAKRLHPDFAANAHDELRRTHLMAQANEAYLRNDAAALHRMLHGYDVSGNWFHREDPAAELARVLTQIAEVRAGINAVLAETTALSQSEMAQLKRTTDHAAANGRDHLAEMAARVRGSIGTVMRRFEYESSPNRRPPSPIDPESLLSAETSPRTTRRS
jgi:hypothetical protein